jgi:spore germination protein GerM
MKNVFFIVAGLTIVVVILVATIVHEQPEPAPVEPIETPVVIEPEPIEPDEPVFDPEGLTSVKVYFSNSEKDPNTEKCEQVYAVEREIEPTLAVAKEALDQLLAGVNEVEEEQEYFTNINSSARVVSVSVENEVATVMFTKEFENGLAGSCRVAAVRSQVEQTLLQFPTVKEVIIKVEGVPDEEVLQP